MTCGSFRSMEPERPVIRAGIAATAGAEAGAATLFTAQFAKLLGMLSTLPATTADGEQG